MTLRECIKQELKYPRKTHGTITVYRVRRDGDTTYTCADWAELEGRPPVAQIWRDWGNKDWKLCHYRKPTKAEKMIIWSFKECEQ